MARPKTGRAPKLSLNLTVSAKVKNLLNRLSLLREKSISEMVEEWAIREANSCGISTDDD